MPKRKKEVEYDRLTETVWGDYDGDEVAIVGVRNKYGEHLAIGCYPKLACLSRAECADIWPILKRFAELGVEDLD